MTTAYSPKSDSIAAILMCALLLGACEAGQKGPETADKAAGRANVEAMAREHANDSTEPSAGAQVAPATGILSQTMPYTESDDELISGYFAAPADMFEPLPAVIMIHEWWGLNDNIRAMADRLAGEGYIVFAVDLFAGKTANSPAEARQMLNISPLS